MHSKLFEDLKPYSSKVLECFRSELTPQQSAERLQSSGFPIADDDLKEGSRFLEALRNFLTIELRDELAKTADGKFLLDQLDYLGNPTNPKGSTKSQVELLKNAVPWLLSWFPNYYRESFRSRYGVDV